MTENHSSVSVAQTVIITLFIAVLLISNIVAAKFIEFWDVIIDGGTILFPLAYILGDVITEVYGFMNARLVILSGFMAMLLMSVVIYVVQVLPPADEWQNQSAYESVLGVVPRIVVGSLIAYLAGELINSYIMARLKVASNGKRLWFRALGSTVVAALVDTALFSLIAFYGNLSVASLINLIVMGYLIKLGVEICVLPVTYRVVNWLKTIEGQTPGQVRVSDHRNVTHTHR